MFCSQGGKSSSVVNCVIALKSYSEWKQNGGIGSWKYSAIPKPSTGKPFVRKNSEPFINLNPISRTVSVDSFCSEQSGVSEAVSELLILFISFRFKLRNHLMALIFHSLKVFRPFSANASSCSSVRQEARRNSNCKRLL